MPSKPIAPNRELDALLAAARNHKMTPAEHRSQRRSWVIGEIMLEHPEMTREQVVAILDEVAP